MTGDAHADPDEEGDAAVDKPEWIAEQLSKVPFVSWDRFVVGERDGYQYVKVYGWIDREDEYKDFVLVKFWPATEYFEFTTSSDKHTEQLHIQWFGEEGLDGHNPCQRVEHTFDIENAIELEDGTRVVTDGGQPAESVENAPQKGITNPPTPASVRSLELHREKGEGSRNRVNRFLRRHHPLGDVPHWVAAWTARYRDYIVAAVVLNRPGRMVDDDKEINIQRLARRDDRPANTCSWLIARARKWAELEGYERIAAHAGVAGNYGTAYEAAGFDCVDVTMADGSGWTSREGRQSWDDYERRKWVDQL